MSMPDAREVHGSGADTVDLGATPAAGQRTDAPRSAPSAAPAAAARDSASEEHEEDAEFARRIDALARRVTAMRRSAAALRQRAEGGQLDRPADVPGDAASDLLCALEELQVAEEELLHQHHELAQARLALDHERQRFQDLFEFAPGAYVVTRLDGRIVEANRAAAELLGIESDTLTQKPLPLYVAAEDRARLRGLLNDMENSSSVDEQTLRLTPRRGAAVPVAVTTAAVRDPNTGAVVGVRWLFRDVTERVRAEEALRRANAELEARVAERTRELAERTAEAELASQGKSDLLATMSHELRTPINAIMGYTQLLELGLAGSITEQQRDYLRRLNASSEHLLALVNDVLDFAKLEAGRLRVARERATTPRVLEAAVALTLPQAEAKGVRLVDASAQAPGVAYVGDENRVRQIVVNLLSNAVKFTHPGGTVTLECGSLAESPAGVRLGGGPWAFIRVSDTGIGIAPEHQASVFEPFVQVEGNERGPYLRTQGGTGLGLAISRRLARLMGGELTVESVLGQGATFTVWLSATDSDEAATERGARPREAAGHRVQGLAEIGEHLQERIDEVLRAHAERLRSDPGLARAAALRKSDLEDHQLAFLADLAQWLVAIDETGGLASDLLRDGSTIQRVVAELHGRARHRQGWTEEQLTREYAILAEELEAVARRHVPQSGDDSAAAIEVMRRLVARAAATARRALRRAAEGQSA